MSEIIRADCQVPVYFLQVDNYFSHGSLGRIYNYPTDLNLNSLAYIRCLLKKDNIYN